MKLFSKYLPAQEAEEGAVKGTWEHSFYEKAIFALEIAREIIVLEGWNSLDLDDIKDLVAVIRILARAMEGDLNLTDEEKKSLAVIEKWRYTQLAPGESEAYVVVAREWDKWRGILTWEEVSKRVVEVDGRKYFRVGQKEWEKWITTPIPAREHIWRAMNAILRTAKKLGMLSIEKWKRPKLILDSTETKLPRLREGGTLPAAEILNNVLYAVIEYTRTTDLRQKVSWLRLAITFLASYTYNTKAREDLEELLKRVITVQRSFNLDLYEYVKAGHFELVKEDEWQAALAKQEELDSIRDELISILLALGLGNLELATIGQKN